MIYLFNDVKELTGTVRNNHILNLLYEREKNGIYSVSAEIPVTYNDQGTIYNYNKKIQKSDFLGHYDKEGRFQLHKIAAVDIENGSIFVKGIHIFFDEAKAGAIIQDRRFINREIIDGARVAFESIGWSVADFDVSVGKTYNFYNVTPLEARQILVETFGFEFDYWLDFDGKKVTNRHVAVKEKIGEKTNKRYTYGHNVLNIRAEQDYSEIYTAVIGRGKGEEIEETGGYGRRIEYTDVVWSKPSKPLNKPAGTRILEDPNATQLFGYKENGVVKPRIKVEVFSDIESPTELIQASYDWLMDNNVPKAVFSLKVADGDGLNLGDEVYVIYRDIDLIKSARVEKVIDDLVGGNRDVEFGDTAYFDTDRRLSGMRSDLKRYSGETGDRIYRLKMEFNRRFDEEVSSWVEEFEQNLIDQQAEIEADRENMTNLIEGTRTEFTDNLNAEITQTKNYAEQQAQAKADSVQTNLDSFKESHQQLYDEVTGNILDIDTFLGDKSKTLKQQFDTVRTDFGILQTDLDGVESDLTATKTDLQKQLDKARADLDGLEVGGRNLLLEQKRISFPTTYEASIASKEIIEDNNLPSGWYLRFNTWSPTGSYSSFYFSATGSYFTEPLAGKSITISMFVRSDVQFTFYGTEVTDEWKKVIRTIDNVSGTNIHWYVNRKATIDISSIKVEKGNIATDWTPAPEDTEQKITTLNQQIEFIDGQLSAKLEQTDLLPINNKITEYGNSLTANAQSIESLISKTELHDGDIAKWSNQTTANAESITSALSRISSTESGLTKAQTDITANANGLSAVVNRVNKTETGIDSLSTRLTAEAGKVETLISKTDGHTTQLANIVADYNSIEQTVAANDEWLGTHGSNVLQTVEGFTQKVWLNDVSEINPNLLSFGDFSHSDIRKYWTAHGSNATAITDDGLYRVRNTNSGTYVAAETPRFKVEAGKNYTLSFKGDKSNIDGTTFNRVYNINDNGQSSNVVGAYLQSNGRHTYKFTASSTGELRVIIGTNTPTGQDVSIYIGFVKVEEGWEETPYLNSFSFIEQTASEIQLSVADSNGLATTLALSSSAMDIITENLNITADMNVAGQITALAVDAIEGNFARLFANQLTANVITSEHIQAGTALVDKMFASSARIDELITKTHFVNEMNALTLNVVDLNASHIRSRLLTVNTIEAEWLKGGTALLDKVFASTAMFERMMAKSGFITSLNTVTIDTDQITIRRPDGGALISQGMQMFGSPVITKPFPGSEVTFDGTNYVTLSRGFQTFERAYGEHSGRWVNIGFALSLRWDSDDASSFVGVVIRPQTMPPGVNVTEMAEQFIAYRDSGSRSYAMRFRLPVPTFGATSFTLEFYRIGDGGKRNYVQIRSERCWTSS